MPCPHNEITIVQRSQRQSAVAAAAYQSGEKLPLILASVKRFSRFVLKDEETFALELQSLWKEKREEKPKQDRKSVV